MSSQLSCGPPDYLNFFDYYFTTRAPQFTVRPLLSKLVFTGQYTVLPNVIVHPCATRTDGPLFVLHRNTCPSVDTGDDGSHRTIIIVVCVIGGVLLLGVAIVLYRRYRASKEGTVWERMVQGGSDVSELGSVRRSFLEPSAEESHYGFEPPPSYPDHDDHGSSSYRML